VSICKICRAPTSEAEACGDACLRQLGCLRLAWDRAAKMVAPNGYYDRRYRQHLRDHNTRGANAMLKEWQTARERLGERP